MRYCKFVRHNCDKWQILEVSLKDPCIYSLIILTKCKRPTTLTHHIYAHPPWMFTLFSMMISGANVKLAIVNKFTQLNTMYISIQFAPLQSCILFQYFSVSEQTTYYRFFQSPYTHTSVSEALLSTLFTFENLRRIRSLSSPGR